MSVESGSQPISCAVVTLQRISVITSRVVWYWVIQSRFLKESVSKKTPDGANNQKDASHLLIRQWWSIITPKKVRVLLYDGHFLQCAAHGLHLSLSFFLAPLSASISHISLSVSSYYPNLSPAVTLHHYLPLIFPLLPSLSLFALPFLLSLTCISLQTLPCFFPRY